MDLLEILTKLIDKSLFIIFFMSCLIILRHLFLFIRHVNTVEPTPYKISKNALTQIGISVSILLTSIIIGIGL